MHQEAHFNIHTIFAITERFFKSDKQTLKNWFPWLWEYCLLPKGETQNPETLKQNKPIHFWDRLIPTGNYLGTSNFPTLQLQINNNLGEDRGRGGSENASNFSPSSGYLLQQLNEKETTAPCQLDTSMASVL